MQNPNAKNLCASAHTYPKLHLMQLKFFSKLIMYSFLPLRLPPLLFARTPTVYQCQSYHWLFWLKNYQPPEMHATVSLSRIWFIDEMNPGNGYYSSPDPYLGKQMAPKIEKSTEPFWRKLRLKYEI